MKERNSKKKMWLSLGLAGALTVGATLALFTDVTGTLTNIFNVFDGNGDKAISLTIKEHDLNGDDNYRIDDDDTLLIEGNTEGTGVTYNNLMPNQIIDKDPTVYMDTDSADSWVVLKVTGLNQPYLSLYQEQGEEGLTNGLSTSWTEITNKLQITSGGGDGGRYFIYEYADDKKLEVLPAIFEHLQVGDIDNAAVDEDDLFTPITAQAAAAQSANTTKKVSIETALSELGVTATYTE